MSPTTIAKRSALDSAIALLAQSTLGSVSAAIKSIVLRHQYLSLTATWHAQTMHRKYAEVLTLSICTGTALDLLLSHRIVVLQQSAPQLIRQSW